MSTRQNRIRSPQKLLILLTTSLLHLGIGATFNHDTSAQEQATGSPLTSVNVSHPITATTPISNTIHHSSQYSVSVSRSEHTRGVLKFLYSEEETCLGECNNEINHVSVREKCHQLLLNFSVGKNQIPQDEMLLTKEKFLLGNVSFSVGNVSAIISEDCVCKCFAETLMKVANDTCALSVNFNESPQKGGGFRSHRFILDNHLINSIFSSSRASIIKALSLRNNNIYNISLNLFEHFVHLEVLDLSQNMLDILNLSQAHFSFLNRLKLSKNKLRLFDSSPCNLTSLYIDNNDITDLSFISKFKNIVILEASHNSITSIPLSILNLTGLRCLHLNQNKIKNVAILENISLKNTYRISLSHNEIEQVNIDFTNHSLKLLILNNNNISYFNFTGAKKLIYLDLCNNRISKIEPTHPLRDSSITGLKLCNNFLSNAYVIMLMKGLRTLNLSNNHIQNLEKMFVNKQQLTHLYLSNVSLQSLDFVKNLSALEVLEVDDNNITLFPKELIKNSIKTLSLSNNPLEPIYCPSRENGKEIIRNCDMSFEDENDNIILNLSMQNKEVNKKMRCILNGKSGKEFLKHCSSNSSSIKESRKQYLLLTILFILNVLYYDAIHVL